MPPYVKFLIINVMSENIKYAVAALESNNFGRIVNLIRAMEGHPDVEEIYKYLADNRSELFQRLLEVKDTL